MKSELRNRSARTFVPALIAAAFVTLLAGAAEAQGRGDAGEGCVVNDEGILECGTIEIHGTLRNIVMVTFSREGLGIRLLELRQSFLEDIVESVGEEPF